MRAGPLCQYRQFTPMIPPIHTMIPAVHSWIPLSGRHPQPEVPPDVTASFQNEIIELFQFNLIVAEGGIIAWILGIIE